MGRVLEVLSVGSGVGCRVLGWVGCRSGSLERQLLVFSFFVFVFIQVLTAQKF